MMLARCEDGGLVRCPDGLPARCQGDDCIGCYTPATVIIQASDWPDTYCVTPGDTSASQQFRFHPAAFTAASVIPQRGGCTWQGVVDVFNARRFSTVNCGSGSGVNNRPVTYFWRLSRLANGRAFVTVMYRYDDDANGEERLFARGDTMDSACDAVFSVTLEHEGDPLCSVQVTSVHAKGVYCAVCSGEVCPKGTPSERLIATVMGVGRPGYESGCQTSDDSCNVGYGGASQDTPPAINGAWELVRIDGGSGQPTYRTAAPFGSREVRTHAGVPSGVCCLGGVTATSTEYFWLTAQFRPRSGGTQPHDVYVDVQTVLDSTDPPATAPTGQWVGRGSFGCPIGVQPEWIYSALFGQWEEQLACYGRFYDDELVRPYCGGAILLEAA